MILLIISTLQGYGQQFLLLGENGGPARAGLTPGLWMFNRAFFNGEFGYACFAGPAAFLRDSVAHVGEQQIRACG